MVKMENIQTEIVQSGILFFVCFTLIYFLLKKSRKKNFPPGPRSLPILGYYPFLGTEPHKTLAKLSKKFGDIMGLYLGFKYTIILNEYKVFKEAISHPSALARSPDIFKHLRDVGFLCANGQEWQEQRRFCVHCLRNAGVGLRPWYDILQDDVNAFLEELASSSGCPMDLTDSLSSALNNNIMYFLVGRRFDKKTEQHKMKVLREFTNIALYLAAPSNLASLIPGLKSLMEYVGFAGYGEANRIITEFENIMREEIKNKQLMKNAVVKNFTDLYAEKMTQKEVEQSNHSQHFFSKRHLEGNAKLLFFAFGDSNFSSLVWLFRQIAAHQEVQRKIQKEIEHVLGKDGVLTYDLRSELPYTQAVILEAQRASSIVLLSTTRCATQDFELGGYTIPKGAELVGNLWAIHNDPDYWEEPEKFKPERFLNQDRTKVIKDLPGYAPFSLGRRKCPGETVAYMVSLVFLTSVLQRFHIRPPAGQKVTFEIVNGLVTHLKPQEMCFIDRKNYQNKES